MRLGAGSVARDATGREEWEVTRTVGKLADRLLSVVAPKSQASAAWLEGYCGRCDQWRYKYWWRLCDGISCSGWYGDPCGSC